jgi:hypothetical protein
MGAKRMKNSALPKQLQLSKARLDDLIDDALTDAYGESEQGPASTRCWRMTLICLSRRKSLA